MKNFDGKLFFFIVGTSLFGLMAAIVMAVTGSRNSVYSNTLLFSLPVLWILWIVLATTTVGSLQKVIAGWCAIDLFALALLVFLYSAVPHSTGPRGEEVVLFIAFSPIVWPMVVVMQAAPDYLLVGYVAFMAETVGLGAPWSDWLGMSILVLLPSFALVAAPRCFRAGWNPLSRHYDTDNGR